MSERSGSLGWALAVEKAIRELERRLVTAEPQGLAEAAARLESSMSEWRRGGVWVSADAAVARDEARRLTRRLGTVSALARQAASGYRWAAERLASVAGAYKADGRPAPPGRGSLAVDG